ncbi:MAG: FAD:protein FMN transferase [Lysobacteraceae bacterium]
MLWLGACALTACAPPPPRFQADALVFGSPAHFIWHADSSAQSDAALADILQHLGRRERDWSLWQASTLTAANVACASGEWFDWPDALQAVYQPSLALWKRSEGLFNPAAGKIIASWHLGHTADSSSSQAWHAPSAAALSAWQADPAGMDDIVFQGRRARCLHPALQWDFNAIAEGAAAQEVAERLHQRGIRDALITLGGDVLALGTAEQRPWRAAIRHPDGGVAAWIELSDGEALFTSGTYARHAEDAQGQQWSHVIDPRSGEAVRGQRAVSVLHPDPLLADAAATALLAAKDDEVQRIARQLGVHCLLRRDSQGDWWIAEAMQPRLHWSSTPERLHVMALGSSCGQKKSAHP